MQRVKIGNERSSLAADSHHTQGERVILEAVHLQLEAHSSRDLVNTK
jgi:hypothetical protein